MEGYVSDSLTKRGGKHEPVDIIQHENNRKL